MNIYRIPYYIIFVFLISCSEEKQQDQDDVSLHPKQENLPYVNKDPEMLEVLDGSEHLDIMPAIVQELYRLLNNEMQTDAHHELGFLTTGDVDISAISDSTLLILEKGANRLIQYDIKADQHQVIADQGRGPGDLYFERELSVYNDKAFIAMQAYRLSLFSCSDGGCEYEKTIQTEYNNYSVTPLENHIYFLGIPPFGRDQEQDPANTDQSLIHKINYEGENKLSYLPVYDFRAPIVRERMNSGGRVRAFSDYDKTIVTFDFMPYLYLHNSEGELVGLYEVPGFIQGVYEYEEDNAGGYRGRLVYDSNSKVSFTSKLGDKWLLMRIREQRNVEFLGMNDGFEGDEWHSYYLFNIDNNRLYKIGKDNRNPVNESRVLHVTDYGIIINDDGKLLLANNFNL